MPLDDMNRPVNISPTVRDEVPGPKGLPLVGIAPHLRKDPLGFLTSMGRRYGSLVRLDLGRETAYLLNHPDYVKMVLQDRHRDFNKSHFIEKLKPLMGEGILTSDGELWQKQRKLIQPLFHRSLFGEMSKIIESEAAKLRDWMGENVGNTVDVSLRMSQFSLDIAVRVFFGTDVSEKDATDTAEFLSIIQDFTADHMWDAFSFQAKIPVPSQLQYKQALLGMKRIVSKIIEEKKSQNSDGDDFISMLINASKECDHIDDQQLLDEVMTMFISGHETTANSLTWVWYFLSKHPDADRRAHREAVEVLGGKMATAADQSQLVYTKMVIQESMRLLPSIWWTTRAPLEDVIIGGYKIPAGSTLLISQYLIHRHPQYWENPEGFDPERFNPQDMKIRHNLSYFPFGCGPRVCIGNHFAMMEMITAIAGVLQDYRLDIPAGHKVDVEPLVTLRPLGGLPMRVVAR